MKDCPDCIRHQDHVDALQRQVRDLLERERLSILRREFRFSPTEAQIALRLYYAKGKPVNRKTLDLYPQTPGNMHVWISLVRQHMGPGRVIKPGLHSYALSDLGLADIAQFLEPVDG